MDSPKLNFLFQMSSTCEVAFIMKIKTRELAKGIYLVRERRYVVVNEQGQ